MAIPAWNGNEFLRADGSRPPIRTLTPVRFDPAANALDVEVVLHGAGPLSTWAATSPLGDPCAVAGTGRGYAIDPAATDIVLAGDESAIPAITVLLQALPPTAAVTVVIESVEPVVVADAARPPRRLDHVGGHRSDATAPGDALGRGRRPRTASRGAGLGRRRGRRRPSAPPAPLRGAGLRRDQAVVRGYWKVGRGGDAED